MEDEKSQFSITLDSDERVNEVVKYLEKKSVQIAGTGTSESFIYPWIIAMIPISMIREISELEGVVRIRELDKGSPGSNNQRTQPKPSAQSLAEQHEVQAWHIANVQGRNTQVGVIDSGFQGLSTRTPANVIRAVTALCFKSGVLNPTNTLSDCEQVTDHGTNVVEKLIAIVPQAKIYISNPRDRDELKQAVNWMTAGDQDNEGIEIGPTPSYITSENNNFNIKVINHSIAYLWDGPGDGSSRTTDLEMYSPLDSADDAINNGAIWVNSAGNEGERTWFSRDIRYYGEYVKFNPAVDNNTCNMVNLKAGHDYTFQLRWSGPWPGADQDLDLYLFSPEQDDNRRIQLEESEAVQNGGDPETFEMIKAMQIATKGQHCLMVKNENKLQNPDWMQLQLHKTDDDEAALRSVLNRLGGIGNPAQAPVSQQ